MHVRFNQAAQLFFFTATLASAFELHATCPRVMDPDCKHFALQYGNFVDETAFIMVWQYGVYIGMFKSDLSRSRFDFVTPTETHIQTLESNTAAYVLKDCEGKVLATIEGYPPQNIYAPTNAPLPAGISFVLYDANNTRIGSAATDETTSSHVVLRADDGSEIATFQKESRLNLNIKGSYDARGILALAALDKFLSTSVPQPHTEPGLILNPGVIVVLCLAGVLGVAAAGTLGYFFKDKCRAQCCQCVS
jgi:hypothetical protein